MFQTSPRPSPPRRGRPPRSPARADHRARRRAGARHRCRARAGRRGRRRRGHRHLPPRRRSLPASEATVRHADTGLGSLTRTAGDVLAPDGTLLGSRELLHPHENEQPFTPLADPRDSAGHRARDAARVRLRARGGRRERGARRSALTARDRESSARGATGTPRTAAPRARVGRARTAPCRCG